LTTPLKEVKADIKISAPGFFFAASHVAGALPMLLPKTIIYLSSYPITSCK